ncbi:spermatogenesis-associated protein 17-like isoform X2 [Ischnura elegans]|uniref:spermatogenesis-associated protein 17-like isoform X2 n=1 Tax=Ischnura elegans TaxID=197161 RepID=UPI001ED8BDE8|nr:spermatogenesis-associated protein 17-like isoform X2 [Ischnura elegans]
MASIQVFIDDISHINLYALGRNEASQREIFKYYRAARCIQRHFRGYMTRQYVKVLIAAATTIQKYWRGKICRRQYEKLLEASKAEELQSAYDQYATLIQKMWRGYLSRKLQFDYYQYRGYVLRINEINKKTLLDLENHRMALLQAEKNECEKEASLWKKKLLRELHPMVRTALVPGIFSLPDSHDLSEAEKIIASFKMPRRKKEKPVEEVKVVQKIGKPFPVCWETSRSRDDRGCIRPTRASGG